MRRFSGVRRGEGSRARPEHCNVLGRDQDARPVSGRHLDTLGVVGRDSDVYGPLSVQISPGNAAYVRISPGNGESALILPGDGTGVRVLFSNIVQMALMRAIVSGYRGLPLLKGHYTRNELPGRKKGRI